MLNKYKFIVTQESWQIESSLWRICRDDIFSIYYRKPILPDLGKYEQQYHFMISRDIISLITGIADSFFGTVLSRPFILKRAENKIYQLQISKSIGFKMPSSLITNVAESANEINNKIIKPLTTGKILHNGYCEIYQTNIIDTIINDIYMTPVYFQEYISKSFEVRLTVVNNEFFGVKIESTNRVDWRDEEAKNTYSLVEIPEHIKRQCVALLGLLDLKFGAFDFIVDQNNEWYFLEINPNGQWLWLEQKLDLTISQEIVRLLVGEET